MRAQGKSLGRQLAKLFAKDLIRLCDGASSAGAKVWFLGRDCDVFAVAFEKKFSNVRYITGLNRENSRKLQHRKMLSR